jgi:hypothetical protein
MIDLSNDWNRFGLIPKVFQSLYSPFDKTMFIDVDTLFKVDFTFMWDTFDKMNQPILCGGFSDENNRSSSHWHWGYIHNVIDKIGINCPSVFSGLIIYNKSFNFLLSKHIINIFNNLNNWNVKSYFLNGYPDEIIYSIIFGFEKIKVSTDLHNWLANQNFCDACNKVDDLKNEFISIGPFCGSAAMIKKANLRMLSYPFDHMFSTLDMIEHCIEDNFETLLNENVIYRNDALFRSVGILETCSSNKYYEKFLYNNDIILGGYSANNENNSLIPVFRHHDLTDNSDKTKLERRCKRFLDILKRNDTIKYFVYTGMHIGKSIDNHISYMHKFSNYIKKWTSMYKIIIINIVINAPVSMSYDSNNIVCYEVSSEEEGANVLKKIGASS